MKYLVMMMVVGLCAGKLAVANDDAAMNKEATTTATATAMSTEDSAGNTTTTKSKTKMSKGSDGKMRSKKMSKTTKENMDGSTETQTEEHHSN